MTNPVSPIEDKVLEDLIVPRFLRYVAYWTTSKRRVEETPSSPGQWELARALAEELKGLGVKDVELSDHGYVIARVPGTKGKENAAPVGFMAHMDTAEDVSGKDVKARYVRNYDGERIPLAGGLALDPKADPDLAAHKGKGIIHTDGNSLLGADDKAGIAEIMAALEYLLKNPGIDRGPLEIIFTPDEETGKGLPEFPLDRIKSAVCYTLDGGPLGELETECFNAYKVDIGFKGRVIHIGTARGTLANAVSMAAAYTAMLPRSESPESTDAYYGYYCPMEIQGNLESARLEVFLRDFDREGMDRRISALEAFARAVEAQFPSGKVTVEPQLQYLNMKEKIEARPELMRTLKRAFENAGVEPRLKPIRGGTDGSRLTELGIPTPNIFTGGRNYHSRLEWVSVPEMAAACRVVIELIKLRGEA